MVSLHVAVMGIKTSRWYHSVLQICQSPGCQVVCLVLIMKMIVLLYGIASFHVLANQTIDSSGGLLGIWSRWDANHYINIAQNGYQASGEKQALLVFFPLFPWMVRALFGLFGEIQLAAFFVSTLASVGLGLLLYHLAAMDKVKSPELAVWFLFIFPTSYFLHIGYTESLFLCFAMGAFWCGRKKIWWLSGLLGCMAALARINAVVLLPALAFEALSEYKQSKRWNPGWLWLLLVPIGLLGYLGVNYLTTGDPFLFLEHQRDNWHRTLTWPWVGINNKLEEFWSNPWENHMVRVQELVFIAIGLIASVFSWFCQRKSYAVWMTGNWWLFTSHTFILSVPRYTITLFPLFLLLARWSKDNLRFNLVSAVSVMFLALFIGQFVRGHWAF